MPIVQGPTAPAPLPRLARRRVLRIGLWPMWPLPMLLGGCQAMSPTGPAGARDAEPPLPATLDAAIVTRWLGEWGALGTHWTGTPVEHASADWLARIARAAGARVVVERYAFERAIAAEGAVVVDGVRIAGLPMLDAGTLGEAGLAGSLGPVGSDATLGLIAASPNGEYEPALVAARRERRHRALVVVTRGGLPGLAPINAPAHPPIDLPVLQVPSNAQAVLEQAAAARRTVTVFATLRRAPGEGRNVVARIAGREPALAPLVVTTPRSAWGPGVGERGGGLVAWIAAARALAAAGPRRPVVLVATSGHEIGHLGADAFEAANPGIMRGAHAWLHLGANIGAVGSRFVCQGSRQDWIDALGDTLARRNVRIDRVVPPGTMPVGEARNIFEAGGQYVSLLASAGPAFHHPDDDLRQVDAARIASVADAVGDVAVRMAG